MEGDWNTSEELQSRREADRTWLQLMHCTLVHTVSYFGKPIGQKRKQGEPKSIFRLEIQEETSEYIYSLCVSSGTSPERWGMGNIHKMIRET